MKFKQKNLSTYVNNRKIQIRVLIGCIFFTLISAPNYAQLQLIKSISVTESTEGGSARPEIVSSADRVFVIYLGNILSGNNRTFDLKIFNKNLDTVVLAKTLVSTTEQFGGPTDIRVVADEESIFAFYETSKIISPSSSATYLWGAKYSLGNNFDKEAYTETPIANSKPMLELNEGEELLDDPAPLIGQSSVFIVTRLKYSIAKSGKMIYKVRELNKSDLRKISEFNLDLSNTADGRARVTSLLFHDGSIFIALATTVSDVGVIESNDDGAISDIVLVKMEQDWTFEPAHDLQIVSAESNDRENYITGLKADENFFYVAYKQSVGSPPNGEHRAIIKVFDKNFSLLHNEIVKTTEWGPNGGELRPSIEIFGNRIFSGQSSGQGLGLGNAEIYLYENHIVTNVDQKTVKPNEYYLSQNYPNPFNPSTTIEYAIPNVETLHATSLPHVTLKVYDILGREIATLVNEQQAPGKYRVKFDVGANRRFALQSGVYFYTLRVGDFSSLRSSEFQITRKMILLK